MPATGRPRRAFTLIEVMVVIAIIGLLVSLLLPALSVVRDEARKAICLSNLRTIGVGIHSYARDNDDRIPYGPKAPPMVTASNFYPSTGAPTSLISLMNGDPVGLGLMLGRQLADEPRVLFCPGSDQPTDADAELAKVGVGQAQCSYYYRHDSVTRQFDPGAGVPPPQHIGLSNLGSNRKGRPISALVMDTQFECPPGFAAFGITPRTHHRTACVNVLYADGHAAQRRNDDGRFTVNLDSYDALTHAFDRILAVFEEAD